MKLFVLLFMLMMPVIASAEESVEEWETVSVSEKYYRMVNYSNGLEDNNIISWQEISQDDYYSSNVNVYALNSSVETTYKKMTTSIATNGSYYRYKVVLDWKNMPKIRSYDIIGIGYYSSVSPKSNSVFSQVYCTSTSNCTTTTSFVEQKFTNGVAAVFALPTNSNIISLTQTYYVDVEKNSSSTIISQVAVGDYSHAVKTISKSNALNFSVNSTNGIVLDSAITDYYDSISYAKATWSGSW